MPARKGARCRPRATRAAQIRAAAPQKRAGRWSEAVDQFKPDRLLVVVVAVGHRMNPNRYTIRRVDGQFLGLVSGAFYKHSTALISAARLIPTDETGTDNSLDTGRVPRYAQQPLSSGMPSKAATKAVA